MTDKPVEAMSTEEFSSHLRKIGTFEFISVDSEEREAFNEICARLRMLEAAKKWGKDNNRKTTLDATDGYENLEINYGERLLSAMLAARERKE